MMRPATRTLTLGLSSSSTRLVGVLSKDLRNRVSSVVLGGIDLLAECLNLFELFAPEFVDILVECQWVPVLADRLGEQ